MSAEEAKSNPNLEETEATGGLSGSSKSVQGSKSNLAGGGSVRNSKTDMSSGRQGKSSASPASAPAPAAEAPANPIMYENTFKLKPDRKFLSEPVKRLVDDILKTKLSKVKYDPLTASDLAKQISNDILQSVKKLDFDRYKYVVDVTIGEFKGQGIRVASRCVWDTTTDSYSSAYYRNATLFAVAIVFGGYQE